MKRREKEEQFFKHIASLYAEKEGEALRDELRQLNNEGTVDHTLSLDKKVNTKIRSIKIRQLTYKLMPVAACLVIFVLYFANPSVRNQDSAIKEEAVTNEQIDFVSAKLPPGYTLSKKDYDKNKTIYYIASNTNNDIVLTTEEFASVIEKEFFQELQIKDTKVYGLVKDDFSVITYEKDNILYTLTSRYDYQDLIELSKSLI